MSSVTLLHPANAAGRNEMPFGRYTRVVPSNTVLHRSPDPPREVKMPHIAKLLWPLMLVFCRKSSVTMTTKRLLLRKYIKSTKEIMRCSTYQHRRNRLIRYIRQEENLCLLV